MLFKHDHEHLRINDRAGIEQFHKSGIHRMSIGLTPGGSVRNHWTPRNSRVTVEAKENKIRSFTLTPCHWKSHVTEGCGRLSIGH
jgi:hypothetical protein